MPVPTRHQRLHQLGRGLFLALAVLVLPSGCSVNPVTGERQLSLMSEAQEIQLGKQHYARTQQASGGDYILDPALNRYISEVGQKLARYSKRSHLPYEFVVLNDSSPNAWALPGGKIAINRGLLLALDSEAELAAVLAHEIVHADAGHTAQSQGLGTLLGAAQVGANILLSRSGHNSALAQQGIAGLGLYGQTSYSRSRELQADEYGMRYMRAAGYDPQAAVRLQQTFVELSKGRQASGFDLLFASHPPSQSRVDANRQTALTLPAGGELGEARYQRAIAALKRRQPAYELADQAQKAIIEENYAEAVKLADRAIAIESRESLFYEIKGVAQSGLNRPSEALKSFNQSVALNPGFFRPLLRRGMLRKELKSMSDAEQDLKASLTMLPTQIAYIELGGIAEERNDCREAVSYYQRASQAGSANQKALQDKILALQSSCQ